MIIHSWIPVLTVDLLKYLKTMLEYFLSSKNTRKCGKSEILILNDNRKRYENDE